MEWFLKETDNKTILSAISEIAKARSLKGAKFLDFGCGENKKFKLQAEKLGAVATGVDVAFGDKIDGLTIPWKDYDVINFAWGIKDRTIKYEGGEHPFEFVFEQKAKETKGAIISVLFDHPNFWTYTNSLPTDKNLYAKIGLLKPIKPVILHKGDVDYYQQLFRVE